MKKFAALVVSISAVSIGLSVSLSGHAQGINGWHWITDGHAAKQIASQPATSTSYIIGTQSAGNGNFFVEQQVGWRAWSRVANGAGVSIAIGSQNLPWVVTSANTIWKLINGAWYTVPNGNCEGGTMGVSRTFKNSNIAVGNGDNAFVIATDGLAEGGTNIRRFTGTCWEIMPGGGKAVEIGMTSVNSDTPWVRTSINTLWYFNGTGWTQNPTAVVTAVGTGAVAGADGTQIWSCSTPQSCSRSTTWNFGVVSAVGNGGAVIGPEDKVYFFTFGN
jgi:hypothetical protein